jgi:hypothetical protein
MLPYQNCHVLVFILYVAKQGLPRAYAESAPPPLSSIHALLYASLHIEEDIW